jgi:hypothetical protein
MRFALGVLCAFLFLVQVAAVWYPSSAKDSPQHIARMAQLCRERPDAPECAFAFHKQFNQDVVVFFSRTLQHVDAFK